jgi:hypothetical protein
VDEKDLESLIAILDGWADAASDFLSGGYVLAAAIFTSCAEELHAWLVEAGLVDTESSVSRQHYIDTGRYLTWQEVQDL